MIHNLGKPATGYYRPNQNWQCGNACHSCHFGPSDKGECQAVAECNPIATETGWKCTRTPLLGGPCDDGPSDSGVCGCAMRHCNPLRSLRWWRGRLTAAVTIATIGALVLLFSRPNANQFLAPGPLSGSHAQVLVDEQRCAACHGAGGTGPLAWIADTLSGGRAIPHSQSDLCIVCHKEKIDSALATNPHNLSFDLLAEMTKKAQSASPNVHVTSGISGQLFNSRTTARDGHAPIACSACHREHHGHDNDLKQLSDRSCQACHRQQFNHFASDHPDFSNWPVARDRSIKFNHNSHAFKHFIEQNKSFDCNSCHQRDPSGDLQLLGTFENTCAECHQPSMMQGSGGWTFFSLPMIDHDAIRGASSAIGEWPAAATGDFDGELPEIMRLLLAADPKAAPALNRLGTNFQFGDVDPDDVQQVRDVTDVLWGIKLLLWDFSVDGKEVVRTRLGALLGNPVSDRELNDLTVGFDQMKFLRARLNWLPDLANEITLKLPNHNSPRRGSQVVHQVVGDRTLVVPESGDVLARPLFQFQDDVLAENPLKKLLGDRSRNPQSAIPLAEQTQLPVVIDGGQTQNAIRIPERIDNRYIDGSVPRQFEFPKSTDDELLAENPLQVFNRNPPRQNQPLGPPASDQTGIDRASEVADPSPQFDSTISSAARIRELEGALVELLRNQRGSWYQDDSTFSISYRHTGHADQYLRSWTEIAVKARHLRVSAADELFRAMTSPTAQGQCFACHSWAGNSAQIHWLPTYRNPAKSQITKFSHAPHIIQPKLNDCQQCHELSGSPAIDGIVAFSDFKVMSKAQCVSCHQPGGAESNCTTCHSYHVHQDIQSYLIETTTPK